MARLRHRLREGDLQSCEALGHGESEPVWTGRRLEPMADGKPGDTTIKTLFAMSGNVCAFRDAEGREPGCEKWLADPGWKSVRARICHIAGRLPQSPRYDDSMTNDERAHFDNLILMCPDHHVQIDDLEPDRFTIAVLHAMKERALEAHAPRMGSQRWASDEQLDRYVALASVAMLRHYAGEEISVAYDVTMADVATASDTATISRQDTVRFERNDMSDPARRGGSGFARTTGFPDPDQGDKMDRHAIQVRQILGYDNVLSVEDLGQPGHISIATNWMPDNLQLEQLRGLANANELRINVSSQGSVRRLP